MDMRPFAAAIFLPYFAFAQNLMVNPGAESAPVGNGWTAASGNWTRRHSGEYPPAYEGSYMFFAGASGGEVELYQDVDVSSMTTNIDNGVQPFTFEDYMRTYPQSPPDQSRVVAEYRNAGGTVLSSFNSGYYSNTNAWQYVTDTRTAPAGTRTIRIRIFSKRDDTNGGTNSDGYHDGMSLVALAPLPIELIDFQAFERKNKVEVNWRTATETQNAHFLVQHSTDGVAFQDLAQLPGKGNSHVENSYKYLHETPSHGMNYYRLKQVDFDGNFEYSHIVSVNIEQRQGKVQVYPNPFSEGFRVQLSADEELHLPARLYDALGRVAWQGTTQETGQSLELSVLPAGVFLLEVEWNNRVEQVKLVKN